MVLKTDSMLTMQHLDGHAIAVVDLETTGSNPAENEICQIAIVPLTIHLDVADITPFYSNICPMFPERVKPQAMATHGIKLGDLMDHAPTHSTVQLLLEDWFDSLPLGHGKKLIPLAHNWPFERSFLVPWLGPELFNSYFHHLYRDTMQMGIFLNDRCALLGQTAAFPYLSLNAMTTQFGIVNKKAHDAYHDCLVTAELYKALLTSVF